MVESKVALMGPLLVGLKVVSKDSMTVDLMVIYSAEMMVVYSAEMMVEP